MLEVNEACSRFPGYASPAEMAKAEMAALYPNPSDRRNLVARLRNEVMIRNLELELRKKDGSRIWGVVNLNLVQAPEGQVIEGTMIDITARRQAAA